VKFHIEVMKMKFKWLIFGMIFTFIISVGIGLGSFSHHVNGAERASQVYTVEVPLDQFEFVIKENFEFFLGEDDWELFGIWIDTVDGIATIMFKNLLGEVK